MFRMAAPLMSSWTSPTPQEASVSELMVIATGQLSRRHTLLLLLQQGGPPPPLSPRSHSPPSSDVGERAGRDGAAIARPRFIASPTPRRLDLSRQGVKIGRAS